MRKTYKHSKKRIYIDNRRFIVIVFSIIVLFISAVPTFAYFTGNLKWISFNDSLNDLLIENGKLGFDINYSEAVWKNDEGTIISEVSNPKNSETITYGPVWVSNNEEGNLTSKVDLLTEYRMDKDGGSDEVLVVEEKDDESVCEPFEVIVGDIDNFGYAVKGDPYLNASSSHDMSVYPAAFDAKGTDRRMVGSGFYDKLYIYNNSIVNRFRHSVYYDANGNGHDGTQNGIYYGYKAPNSYTLDNGVQNNYFLYDGYTEVAISGKYGGTFYDDKDWSCLQKSEPLTFKYDEITKDIKSVVFQIFTDDIQSQAASNVASNQYFGKASGSIFKVYLNGVEIKEFTNQINKVCQSGPKGNIVTLTLPIEYYYIIEEASGLDSGGLELLIDDKDGWNNKYDYITGDSFAIDFAKMIVNAQATGSVGDDYYGTVKGYIKDVYGNPIEGVRIYASTGEETFTDSSGYYEIRTYKITVKLSISKENYESKIIYAGTDEESIEDVVLKYSDIVMQEKYEVLVSAIKCDLNGNVIKDENGNDIKITKSSRELNDNNYYIRKSETIIREAFKLDFDEDTKYKLEYKLILKDRDSIGDRHDFSIDFSINNIKVRGTQENNSGWTVAGTGDDYRSSYNNIGYNETPPSDDNLGDDKTTKIYFEVPDTDYFGSIDETDFILNGERLTESDGRKVNMGNWYEFDFYKYNEISASLNNNRGTIITVKSINDTSGELYWFTTQKVFICTN